MDQFVNLTGGHIATLFSQSILDFLIFEESTFVGIKSFKFTSQGIELVLIKVFDQHVKTCLLKNRHTFVVFQFVYSVSM